MTRDLSRASSRTGAGLMSDGRFFTGVPGRPRMRRRHAIALVGGAAASIVLAHGRARAQPIPVIGYLGSETPERYGSRIPAFNEGLADAGFAVGRTVTIEYRWADGLYSRLPSLAKALVNLDVAVIAA